MPRASKSSWDFGELFGPEQGRKVYAVAELTQRVRQLLEQGFPTLWVSGEISNLRVQSSGHVYFSLKDAAAQLQCVLFRGASGIDRSQLRDGSKVVVGGALTVYEPRGQYQLRVQSVEAQGLGALQAAFERLKRKLESEGLFAPERKRSLPRFPATLGIATSPTGAALRDVLHVIRRRHPGLEIILAPCRVQGEEAAGEIASAIASLNECSIRFQPIHVILVTRGGGSLEDLWAFNEEAVARAIAASSIPVVSAVGHEIDFTISDFVADLRAATPSAAAEILTEGFHHARQSLDSTGPALNATVRRSLRRERENIALIGKNLARNHPARWVQEQFQRIDDLADSIRAALKNGLREFQASLAHARLRMTAADPRERIGERRRYLAQIARRNALAIQRFRERFHLRVASASNRLHLLSPDHTLRRGYSITLQSESGKVVRSPDDAPPGLELRTVLAQGEISSVVSKKKPGPLVRG